MGKMKRTSRKFYWYDWRTATVEGSVYADSMYHAILKSVKAVIRNWSHPNENIVRIEILVKKTE